MGPSREPTKRNEPDQNIDQNLEQTVQPDQTLNEGSNVNVDKVLAQPSKPTITSAHGIQEIKPQEATATLEVQPDIVNQNQAKHEVTIPSLVNYVKDLNGKTHNMITMSGSIGGIYQEVDRNYDSEMQEVVVNELEKCMYLLDTDPDAAKDTLKELFKEVNKLNHPDFSLKNTFLSVIAKAQVKANADVKDITTTINSISDKKEFKDVKLDAIQELFRDKINKLDLSQFNMTEKSLNYDDFQKNLTTYVEGQELMASLKEIDNWRACAQALNKAMAIENSPSADSKKIEAIAYTALRYADEVITKGGKESVLEKWFLSETDKAKLQANAIELLAKNDKTLDKYSRDFLIDYVDKIGVSYKKNHAIKSIVNVLLTDSVQQLDGQETVMRYNELNQIADKAVGNKTRSELSLQLTKSTMLTAQAVAQDGSIKEAKQLLASALESAQLAKNRFVKDQNLASIANIATSIMDEYAQAGFADIKQSNGNTENLNLASEYRQIAEIAIKNIKDTDTRNQVIDNLITVQKEILSNINVRDAIKSLESQAEKDNVKIQLSNIAIEYTDGCLAAAQLTKGKEAKANRIEAASVFLLGQTKILSNVGLHGTCEFIQDRVTQSVEKNRKALGEKAKGIAEEIINSRVDLVKSVKTSSGKSSQFHDALMTGLKKKAIAAALLAGNKQDKEELMSKAVHRLYKETDFFKQDQSSAEIQKSINMANNLISIKGRNLGISIGEAKQLKREMAVSLVTELRRDAKKDEKLSALEKYKATMQIADQNKLLKRERDIVRKEMVEKYLEIAAKTTDATARTSLYQEAAVELKKIKNKDMRHNTCITMAEHVGKDSAIRYHNPDAHRLAKNLVKIANTSKSQIERAQVKTAVALLTNDPKKMLRQATKDLNKTMAEKSINGKSATEIRKELIVKQMSDRIMDRKYITNNAYRLSMNKDNADFLHSLYKQAGTPINKHARAIVKDLQNVFRDKLMSYSARYLDPVERVQYYRDLARDRAQMQRFERSQRWWITQVFMLAPHTFSRLFDKDNLNTITNLVKAENRKQVKKDNVAMYISNGFVSLNPLDTIRFPMHYLSKILPGGYLGYKDPAELAGNYKFDLRNGNYSKS